MLMKILQPWLVCSSNKLPRAPVQVNQLENIAINQPLTEYESNNIVNNNVDVGEKNEKEQTQDKVEITEHNVENNFGLICDYTVQYSKKSVNNNLPSSPFIGSNSQAPLFRDQIQQEVQAVEALPDYRKTIEASDIMMLTKVRSGSIDKHGLDLEIDIQRDLDPPISNAELRGIGGYGQVFKTTYKSKRAAVKIFNIEHQSPIIDSDVDNFLQELGLICRLKHENIVECYGACLKCGDRAIVMEYVDNSLYEYIHNRSEGQRPSLKHIYKIVKEIAKALQFLHYNKIVHRDLHPKNVLITSDKCVKVADFGISRIVKHSLLSRDRAQGGAVQYMAPEIFENTVCKSSDIYSLGIIAWELYTCQAPWNQEGYGTVIRSVRNGDRPPIPADMPKDLKNIIQQCWNGNYKNRPKAKRVCNLCREAIARIS